MEARWFGGGDGLATAANSGRPLGLPLFAVVGVAWFGGGAICGGIPATIRGGAVWRFGGWLAGGMAAVVRVVRSDDKRLGRWCGATTCGMSGGAEPVSRDSGPGGLGGGSPPADFLAVSLSAGF
jgi:hypothetical protein